MQVFWHVKDMNVSEASPAYNFKYMLINGTIIGDNKIYYAQSTKNTSAATVKLIYFGIKS